MINFLKKISHHPFIIRLIRFFHLQPIFRRWYYHLARPSDGILRFQVGGINSHFYVSKPEELRSLESDKEGEGRVAELLISHLRLGDIVYDIGAHIGFYTVILGRAVGKNGQVIAFEPEKESYNRLLENLKLNDLNNIQVFQKALGNENSQAKLYRGETIGNFSLIKTYEKAIDYRIVEIVKGDQFVKEQNLPIPRLVKIDVEGYEYVVLEGLQKTLSHPNCEIICCEIHPHLLPSGITEEKILKIIKFFGFRQLDIYRRVNDYHLIAFKKRRPRVLVCAYACLGESGVKVGGGEAVLGWNIVKQLARFHKVFVLTHSQNCLIIEKILKREPLDNVKFYYLDLPGWLRFLQKFQGGIQLYAYLWQIKAYFLARKLHQRFHFDVFHHVTYANDWMASFIGALLPIPYIRGPGGGAHRIPKGFFQGFSFREYLWDLFRAVAQWFSRHDPFFILGQWRARAILVCSRESLKVVPKRWRQKTYLFSVNGVTKRDLTLLAPRRKTPGNKFHVFSVGKLIRIKGFNLAIKAFKIFADKVPEAELTIIGDGPELSRLKNLVYQLGLEGKVHFLGWMPREELLLKMPTFDLFLFPGLGGTIVMEAMAAGKPVICLDIASPGTHVTNNCGIKIRPSSPDQAIKEMAEALDRLYRDKELRLRLGKAARERVEREYLWDRLGEELFKIYQEVFKI